MMLKLEPGQSVTLSNFDFADGDTIHVACGQGEETPRPVIHQQVTAERLYVSSSMLLSAPEEIPAWAGLATHVQAHYIRMAAYYNGLTS